MAPHPSHHLDTTLQNERVDFYEIGVGERKNLAISVKPCVHQIGNIFPILDEGQRTRQIVQMPAKAEIVKVDNLDYIAIDQDIGVAQVGMDHAIVQIGFAVAVQSCLDDLATALDFRQSCSRNPSESA